LIAELEGKVASLRVWQHDVRTAWRTACEHSEDCGGATVVFYTCYFDDVADAIARPAVNDLDDTWRGGGVKRHG